MEKLFKIYWEKEKKIEMFYANSAIRVYLIRFFLNFQQLFKIEFLHFSGSSENLFNCKIKSRELFIFLNKIYNFSLNKIEVVFVIY